MKKKEPKELPEIIPGEGEEITADTIDELSNGKGDDDDE